MRVLCAAYQLIPIEKWTEYWIYCPYLFQNWNHFLAGAAGVV
jgi:hypothetical protein